MDQRLGVVAANVDEAFDVGDVRPFRVEDLRR